MTLTCNGTLVGVRVSGEPNSGSEVPRVLIWRKNTSAGGEIYYKVEPEIVLNILTCCGEAVRETSDNMYEIRLPVESQQVSVQPGDLLGLQLPPRNDSNFDLYFTTGGPVNFNFVGRIGSSIDLSTDDVRWTRNVTQLPQISIMIVLGKCDFEIIILPKVFLINSLTINTFVDIYCSK